MVRVNGTHTVKWGKGGGGVALIGTLDYTVKIAASTPGPGAYQTQKFPKVPCPKFGSHAGKTYLEEVVYLRKDIPGPNSYPLPPSMDSIKGGRFSVGNVPTFSEAAAKLAAGPGPGKYIPPMLEKPLGGRLPPKNSKSAPSALDVIARRASQLPAPGQYGALLLPPAGGGRFGRGYGKDFTAEKRAKSWQVPGPQHYGILPVQGAKPRDIKIGGNRSKTEVDILCDIARKIPGPGNYDIMHGYEMSTFSHKERDDKPEWERGEVVVDLSVSRDDLLIGGTADESVSVLSKRYADLKASLGRQSGKAKALYSSSHASTRHMIGDFSDCTLPMPKMRFSY